MEVINFFIETECDQGIEIILPKISQQYHDEIIESIIKYIEYHPRIISIIISKFHVKEKDAIRILQKLSSVTEFSKDYSLTLYSLLNSFFPKIGKVNHFNSKLIHNDDETMSYIWKEDTNSFLSDGVTNNDHKFCDIWKYPIISEKCSNDDSRKPCFLCLSCGHQDNICLSCALHCHKNHNVIFIDYCNFTCKCNENGKCMFFDTSNSFDVNNEIINSNFSMVTIMKMFSQVMKTNYDRIIESNMCLPSNDNDFLKRTNLYKLEKIAITNYHLELIIDHFLSDELPKSSISNNFQHLYSERSFYSPLKLVETNNSFLFIALNHSILVYDHFFHFITQFHSVDNIIYIKEIFNYLVVASLSSFQIFQICTNYPLLMYEKLEMDYDNYILDIKSAELPNNKIIVVTTRKYASFYMIDAENILPPRIIHAPQTTKITSTVIMSSSSKNYLILAFSSGQIAWITFSKEIINFNETIKLIYSKCSIRKDDLILSYSSSKKLFFISYTKIPELLILNEESIISQYSNQKAFCVDALDSLIFSQVHTKFPNTLFFTSTKNNRLYSLEFTNNYLMSGQIKNNMNADPKYLYEYSLDYYGFFAFQNQYFILSHDGLLLQITKKSHSQIPASFWSMSTIGTADHVFITGMDPDIDYNPLLSNNSRLFQEKNNVLTISSRDHDFLIVGVILHLGDSNQSLVPLNIQVNNQKTYFTYENQYWSLSFGPKELRDKIELTFTSINDRNFVIKGIKVFIIQKEIIKPFLQPQKFVYPCFTDISEMLNQFISDKLDHIDTVKEEILVKLINSIPLDKSKYLHEYEDNLNDYNSLFYYHSFKEIIGSMYCDEHFYDFSRTFLSKIYQGDAEWKNFITKKWCKAIKEIINETENKDLRWNLLWSDYSLMPIDDRKSISSNLWEKNSNVESIESVIAAFSSY
ncbi:hypothetical protein TRFO_18290 [Tritrichomonas foetus]|uniref:UBR-type domain-containing protein n=1 Tax=Tritrichomonas foetus TaxID=1144522 RepID=A0A1J4KQR1_9EUKA|nr:hypothetical protein TRFO_18290 [Tritrichomonas foetus]|eukprot:OHT12006.1 hypothetical protein TRFO_18290 [Tritrichomonas foetus]